MNTCRFPHVAVVGANSQIGGLLVPRLMANGNRVARIGRERSTASAESMHVFDESRGYFTPALPSADAIISLAPLPHIGAVLRMAESLGARRVVAFGSTGRFTKVGSASALERDFVKQQLEAEQLFATMSRSQGVDWTLFRPTMIYGVDADLNVAFIASVIRRFGVFPVALGATGLRQPVHADDLAAACVAALECDKACNRAYNLGGGERLTYGDMVRRIFVSQGKRPCLIPIPAAIYRLMIRVARRSSRYSFVSEDMVTRMFQDLIADHADAVTDFGYAPRVFCP